MSSCLSYSTICKCLCWFLNKSSSQKKEAKASKFVAVFSENQMSDLDRACLLEIGCKSRLWRRVAEESEQHTCGVRW